MSPKRSYQRENNYYTLCTNYSLPKPEVNVVECLIDEDYIIMANDKLFNYDFKAHD